jgi:radical SAM superfamily enzyme
MRLLKNDVPAYLDGDQDMIKVNLQLGVQEEKVEVLDSIIKTIGNRGFQLKNYIDWKKFENGLA